MVQWVPGYVGLYVNERQDIISGFMGNGRTDMAGSQI